MGPCLSLVLLALATTIGSFCVHAQVSGASQDDVLFDKSPVNYSSNDVNDPVVDLQQKLNSGQATLTYEPRHGYLQSVLKALQIPAASQTLVFSKTSFQFPLISPTHPRALYFNDDVYVGHAHEGKAIEVVSFDPMKGPIFYLLNENEVQKPSFERQGLDCLKCHINPGTHNVPGVFLESIDPSWSGAQVPGTQILVTDQTSAFRSRWGGWYVTGKFDSQRILSMANAVAMDDGPEGPSVKPQLTSLSDRMIPDEYLRGDQSDIVALLVLAHQTQMHNLITMTNYQTRIALFDQKLISAASMADLPKNVRQKSEVVAEQLLHYMLFVNEVPLTGLGLEENLQSDFARDFSSRGPRDSSGRSLRDFDLRNHLFRYPCSYLIYSSSFDSIPEPAKSYIYHRLFQVFTGQDQSAEFAAIDPHAKRAAFEILLATKRDLPEEWLTYAIKGLTQAPKTSPF